MTTNVSAGTDASLTIATVDDAGAAIPGVSATWALYDQVGEQVTTGSVSGYGTDESSVSIEIDKQFITIEENTEGREVVVFITQDDSDIVEVRDYFLIVNNNPLEIMSNSCMSYVEALALRTEFGSLDGWDANVDVDVRAAAMRQAFAHLSRIRFKVPGVSRFNHVHTDELYTKSYFHLQRATVADWNDSNKDFRRCMKRAQMQEANNLLGGDPIGKKRAEGIISETIGESSMFFRATPYLNLPISRQAYDEVKGYITLRVDIARA